MDSKCKRTVENEPEARLKGLGFKFRAPTDTFSAQPGSSSSIGDERGKLDGITGGVASEETLEHRLDAEVLIDTVAAQSVDLESAGVSNFSDITSSGELLIESLAPEYEEAELSDEALKSMIYDRLRINTQIDERKIDVRVQNGDVEVRGTVTSPAERERVQEIVGAVLRGRDFQNYLAA